MKPVVSGLSFLKGCVNMIRITRKSMIWSLILMLALVLSYLPVSTVFATAHTTVTIDGRALQLDVPPTIIEGRTLVPLRAIFEALGSNVEWNSITRTVTGRKDTTTIILPIGSRSPTVNGVTVQLDVPGTIVNGRTLVPVRFIAESLGASVEWVQDTRTVVIISNDLTEVTQAIPASPPLPTAQDLQSRIEREPIVAYFGKSMQEIKSVFGSPTDLSSDGQYYNYMDQNLAFIFYDGKVKFIRLLNFNTTGQHNFLGFGRGTRLDDVTNELGPFDWEEDETDEIYFGYSTAGYGVNFWGAENYSELLTSIEVYKK